METTVINLKTDKALKNEAQEVARTLGLPLGTILNAYLRDLVRTRRVVISAPLVPNARTRKILDEIMSEDLSEKPKKGMAAAEAIQHLRSLSK